MKFITSTLKIKAIGSPEKTVYFYQTIRHHKSKSNDICRQRRENFRCQYVTLRFESLIIYRRDISLCGKSSIRKAMLLVAVMSGGRRADGAMCLINDIYILFLPCLLHSAWPYKATSRHWPAVPYLRNQMTCGNLVLSRMVSTLKIFPCPSALTNDYRVTLRWVGFKL
jgi:hypothetical protein